MKILLILIVLFLIAKVKNVPINRVTLISIVMITALILVLSLAIYPPAFHFLIGI